MGAEMFNEITIPLISSLILYMALFVLGEWSSIHFYAMVSQFSTVYFVFQSNLIFKLIHVVIFVKIPFQHQKQNIYVKYMLN